MRDPALAIITNADGSRSPITLPVGAIVSVMDHALDGHELIEVVWASKLVQMFTSDIREHGTPVAGET